MRASTCIMFGMLLMIGIGCASVKEIDTKNYYNQKMTDSLISFESKGPMRILIEGSDAKISVNTVLPMRNIIPRDPGFLETIGQNLPSLAGFWFLGEALRAKPTIVQQPAPIVVDQPYVVRP